MARRYFAKFGLGLSGVAMGGFIFARTQLGFLTFTKCRYGVSKHNQIHLNFVILSQVASFGLCGSFQKRGDRSRDAKSDAYFKGHGHQQKEADNYAKGEGGRGTGGH